MILRNAMIAMSAAAALCAAPAAATTMTVMQTFEVNPDPDDGTPFLFEDDVNAGVNSGRPITFDFEEDIAGVEIISATISGFFGVDGNANENPVSVFAETNPDPIFRCVNGTDCDGGEGVFFEEEITDLALLEDGFLSLSLRGGIGGGNIVISDLLLTINVAAPIPVPAALPMLLVGLGGLALMRRRNKVDAAA
ncbi:MAG: VPLPA-CTERM sorting domain-containing protein [Pseudomonadota bacterium]